jgi:hypothetical protein
VSSSSPEASNFVYRVILQGIPIQYEVDGTRELLSSALNLNESTRIEVCSPAFRDYHVEKMAVVGFDPVPPKLSSNSKDEWKLKFDTKTGQSIAVTIDSHFGVLTVLYSRTILPTN